MAEPKLHPAFDPSTCTCNEERESSAEVLARYYAAAMEETEYAIEQELSRLQSEEAGRIQMDRFVRLLQTVRDEQIALRKDLNRLIEVIAA